MYVLCLLFVASQMWCLGQFLPTMIGHWVPNDNENWQEFLLFLEILDILFAPELLPEDVALLSVLIEDHHREFKVLYPCIIIFHSKNALYAAHAKTYQKVS